MSNEKVMKLLSSGMSAKEVARKRGCSIQSIYNIASRMRSRTQTSKSRTATHSVNTHEPMKFPRLSPNGQKAQDHLVLFRQELMAKQNAIDLQLKLTSELEKLLGVVGD